MNNSAYRIRTYTYLDDLNSLGYQDRGVLEHHCCYFCSISITFPKAKVLAFSTGIFFVKQYLGNSNKFCVSFKKIKIANFLKNEKLVTFNILWFWLQNLHGDKYVASKVYERENCFKIYFIVFL